jgi:hypothetical protein
MTPPSGCTDPAIMNVNFNHKVHSFEVKPGPEGYAAFTSAIRCAFSLPTDSELNITFTCDDPISGLMLSLQGAGAYDAAVHCAAISAARRTLASGPLSSSSLQDSRRERPRHSLSRRNSGSGSSMHQVASGSSNHTVEGAPRGQHVQIHDWNLRNIPASGILDIGWMLACRAVDVSYWMHKFRSLHHHPEEDN